MAAIDLEQIKAGLKAVSAAQGFNAFLGVALERVAAGEVEITLALRPDLIQHHGFAHGGIIGALADDACAWAAATVLGDVVTSGYSIQFAAPATGTSLRAVGTVLRAGKRQATVEARVFSEQAGAASSLVAVALGSVAAVRRD